MFNGSTLNVEHKEMTNAVCRSVKKITTQRKKHSQKDANTHIPKKDVFVFASPRLSECPTPLSTETHIVERNDGTDKKQIGR
jgi:hypothetical protein